MKFGKKGQESFEIIMEIPRLIFIVIVAFSIVFLVRLYITDSLNVQRLQSDVFANKIYYSPNGILFFDEELRQTTPGVIDISKLTNDTLNALANYGDESFIAAKITVYDMNNIVVASALYNEKTYYRWIPLLRIGLEGAGGVKQINKTLFIEYVKDGQRHNGFLQIITLQPGN